MPTLNDLVVAEAEVKRLSEENAWLKGQLGKDTLVGWAFKAAKLGLLLTGVGLGAASAVFGLSMAIYVSLQMLGLKP